MVLPMSYEAAERISSLTENYVQGGREKMARNKLLAPVCEGILNLINIRLFKKALKVGLVKHINKFW